MKIAVFGAGGVGGYYGARLAEAGQEVHFIARGRHLAAIRDHGLRIKSANGDIHVADANATDDPGAIGPVDWVLVTVKLYDTAAAARGCKALIGPGTAVVSLQNGVTAVETFSAALGAGHVVGGMTQILAVVEAPGVIAHTGTMARLVFGEVDGTASPRVEALRRACEKAAIDTTVSGHVIADIWGKFIFLAAFSGMTALTRLPMGPIRADAETRAMLVAAVEEVARVAEARGVALSADAVANTMKFADGLPAEMGSSMLHDLTQGRRLELAWLSGAVVRLGAELGVPTPVHAIIQTALKLHADGAA